ALILSWAVGFPTLADEDPCAGFKWDVSKERRLFESAPLPLAATGTVDSAPEVTSNRFYEIKLLPASQVSFAALPGKKPAENSYAGMARLTIPASGRYRIAIDGPYWIDVVVDGKLVVPTDYEGLHGCTTPRKIVEFELDRAQRLVVQLSGATFALIRMTIVPVPVI
ncbi:MAG TPA: hypothetical protein VK437_03450, partial [Steroidobacteraceae bacterium]|nr:hypothetical protein [Steroidobacteraceae bacterium]